MNEDFNYEKIVQEGKEKNDYSFAIRELLKY